MMLHIPLLVNASLDNGALHYGLHVVVVASSLLMWMPVCGPVPEFRMGIPGAMIYLFLQSVVPTVPAAWLTFAEGIVYDAYDQPLRLWGISAVDDQQLAGAVMKVAGGFFLWSVVIYLFFKKFAVRDDEAYDFRRRGRIPSAEIIGHDEVPITTADVEREFAASTPPPDA
jgi:putative membrane protein